MCTYITVAAAVRILVFRLNLSVNFIFYLFNILSLTPKTRVQVRERSARSVPMGKMGVNRTAGTPDSLSDNESSPYSRTPIRKPSTPATRKSSAGLTGSLPASRPGSRPQSRQGSKPPSRHGSNLSLDSTGEPCTTIILNNVSRIVERRQQNDRMKSV